MKQKISKSRGQFLIEYAAIVVAVSSFVAAITIFVQRHLKDKMHAAQNYAAGKMPGDDEYEPYYSEKTEAIDSFGSRTMEFPGDGSVKVTNGDVTKTIFDRTTCAENGQCDQ